MLHYIGTGLKNIHLVNGYVVHPDRSIAIHNLTGLHKAIAWELSNSVADITGDEFKFLRVFCDMGQRALGDVLKVGESTVSNWERGNTPVPGAAAEWLRALVRERISGNAKLVEALDRLNHIDRERTALELRFAESGGDWSLAA